MVTARITAGVVRVSARDLRLGTRKPAEDQACAGPPPGSIDLSIARTESGGRLLIDAPRASQDTWKPIQLKFFALAEQAAAEVGNLLIC